MAGLGLAAEVTDALERWMLHPRYASERPALKSLVAEAQAGSAAAKAEIVDAFSRTLPIGTGGRRGKVGPGPNRFNTVVVRETAQGVADALHRAGDAPKVVIVYDTRRDSRTFAHVAAEQLAANDIQVTLIDAPRPTPELSFMVRRLGCGAGIVLSASHNPPEDNGIKIYGPDGAQVLGARDAALMAAILAVAGLPELPRAGDAQLSTIRVIAGDAIASEADAPYHDYVRAQGVVRGSLASSGLKIAFTPLHGVGHTSVLPVLRSRGLEVHAVAAQCDPDGGNFSTVRSANPELPESMAMAIDLAREVGADLVLATDPDADRLGACVRVRGEYLPIDGNRLGVLMLDHVLRNQRPPAKGWVLTTLVTSPLIGTLARAAGVDVVDDLLVGFKHHAGMMAEEPGKTLIFGCEESHGFMRGDDVRDKDGAIAALLLSECAAQARDEGKTLMDVLADVWCEQGYHREKTANLVAAGISGRRAIAAVMDAWRAKPPTAFAGLHVVSVDDRYAPRWTGSATRDLPGNVLSFELAAGDRACRLVLRPSGTEPKLKVYALARSHGPIAPDTLTAVQVDVDGLIDRVLADAESAARAIMAPYLEA
ncbi:MAG: phospho-sugar mutase [Myxococcales bacterium]|nr:phospho-sugar mutase [Myxococcales bacterium]